MLNTQYGLPKAKTTGSQLAGDASDLLYNLSEITINGISLGLRKCANWIDEQNERVNMDRRIETKRHELVKQGFANEEKDKLQAFYYRKKIQDINYEIKEVNYQAKLQEKYNELSDIKRKAQERLATAMKGNAELDAISSKEKAEQEAKPPYLRNKNVMKIGA